MDLRDSRRDADRDLASLLREPRLLEGVPEHSVGVLVEAAEHHGAAALLLDRAAEEGVPLGPAWAALRERAAGQAAACAVRDAEALKVLARLRTAGLPFVVLKGLALAYTVYQHPWMRGRSDTDLLLRESDLPRFERVFEEMGYTVLPHVRGRLTLPQRHYYREDRRGFRHAWDLHWRLTSSQALRFAVAEDELTSRAEPVLVLEGALVPSRPDALHLACIHRLAHHFDDPRLIWLWDIRLLLQAMSERELARFAHLASRPASAAACGHSLAVAREHVGARIPEVLQPLLDMQGPAPAAFLWSGSRRPITYLIGELRSAPPRDRVRLLRERVLPSLSSMRERYPSVPGIALPLAYAWRLIVGIPKWLGASR